MDDKCKLMLIQALQDTIRLKEEVWRLNDLLSPPDDTTKALNTDSRQREIEEIQNQLSQITGLD